MNPLPDYSAYRFLLVDDEPFLLALHERLLKGCRPDAIVTARDGESALRAFEGEAAKFDCIVTDFDMQPMNGLQLLSAIRRGVNPVIPRDLRVVMVTGNLDADVKEAARRLDVNGFIAKPVRASALYGTIDQALLRSVQAEAVEAYQAIVLPASSHEGPSRLLPRRDV